MGNAPMSYAIASCLRPFAPSWLCRRLQDSLDAQLAILLPDTPGRDLGVVLEQNQIVALHRLAQERALEGQRIHRVKVVAHDVRQRQVRRRRQQVGGEDRRLPAGLDITIW